MQRYADYNFTGWFYSRTVIQIVIGLVIFLSFSAKEKNEPVEVDPMYSRWKKSQNSIPLFYYSIKDINDPREREKLLNHRQLENLSFVCIEDGTSIYVKEFISNWNRDIDVPPVFVAKVGRLFDYPFASKQWQVSGMEVECLTNDSLVYQLGVLHGFSLHKLGIDVVRFEVNVAHYTDKEWSKAIQYLKGLADAQVYFSFDIQSKALLTHWVQTNMYRNVISLHSEFSNADYSSTKKFRRETGYEGLIEQKLSNAEDSLACRHFWKQGIQIIDMTSLSTLSYSLTEVSQELKRKEVRNSVKSYFEIRKQIKEEDMDHTFQYVVPSISNLNDLISVKSKVLVREITPHVLDQFYVEDVAISVVAGASQLDEVHRVDRYRKAKYFDHSLFQMPLEYAFNVLPQKSIILIQLAQKEKEELIELNQWINALGNERNVVVMYAGDIKDIAYLTGHYSLFWQQNVTDESLDQSIQMLFGAYAIEGRLPGYLSQNMPNLSATRPCKGQLKYALKPISSIDYQYLYNIDTLVKNSIENNEMPGCQIMMIKNGVVVYDKAFGYQSYDQKVPVCWNTIYDLASITKVVATVPLMMQEVQNHGISLDQQLGEVSINFKETDKANLKISDILMHQSGLRSYVPFWKSAVFVTQDSTFYYDQLNKGERSIKYDQKIQWTDSIHQWIVQSTFNSLTKPDNTYGYLYSDLGFMILKEILEEKHGSAFDLQVEHSIIRPLAMDHTFFNPLKHVPNTQIAPTENDTYFRKTLLKGNVHDKNTALLGGVSGHAGLFSNANDVSKYMQMILQGGFYNGKQIVADSIVKKFTAKQSLNNRRALGWDMLDRKVSNATVLASDRSFGHTGFTGGMIWADPEYDMIYVFLSNRIHPNEENTKLIKNNTRTRIQDLMYRSILSNETVLDQDL